MDSSAGFLPHAQALSRERPQELHAAAHRGLQPVVELLRLQDHDHAFLVGWLVEQVHQRMLVGIDGQHGEAMHDLTPG